jgi:hypothetical protein
MSALLDRILDPFAACFTPDVAKRVAELCADAEAQARLDELAEKADEGLLTDEEAAEYAAFRDVFYDITILQSKARAALKNHTAG